MDIIPIRIIDRKSKLVAGQVDLPSFCIDHMKMTPPEANAKTMRSHIEKKCSGLGGFKRMYINNRDVTGSIVADDLNSPGGVVIEVE
jgi:hypothetical protein